MNNNIARTFSDVLIIPKYSEIESRSTVNLSSDLGAFKLDLPIFSANMKTITGPDMCIAMFKAGGMGILHRFCSIEEAVNDFQQVINYTEENVVISTGSGIAYEGNREFHTISGNTGPINIRNTNSKPISEYSVGVSIGVQESDKERFDKLYEKGARIFCLDIAHGHSLFAKKMLMWIKSHNLNDIFIMAGNVATGDAFYDLCDWGADVVKCGVGPGSACETRKNTGVGVPQLYALEQVAEERKRQGLKNKIICDGGIKFVGDISKAMKYADGCMLGKFLSGVKENPGPVFKNKYGQYYKVYAGSASGENKYSNGNTTDYIEGVAHEIPFRGKVKYILKEIKEGLQSAFSYVGAKNIKEFQEKCEFVEISNGGKEESKI